VSNERELLLSALVDTVHQWDPEFLVGYEMQVALLDLTTLSVVGAQIKRSFCFAMHLRHQMSSWGYALERASLLVPKPSPSLDIAISRTPGSQKSDRRHGADEWGATHSSDIWIMGRTMLNVWRCHSRSIVCILLSNDHFL
jgi:hypothetical protein